MTRAFEASALYHQLENGLLQDRFVLISDSAYINSLFFATSFPTIKSGSHDDTISIILRYVSGLH